LASSLQGGPAQGLQHVVYACVAESVKDVACSSRCTA
jgi:hypothetical protein